MHGTVVDDEFVHVGVPSLKGLHQIEQCQNFAGQGLAAVQRRGAGLPDCLQLPHGVRMCILAQALHFSFQHGALALNGCVQCLILRFLRLQLCLQFLFQRPGRCGIDHGRQNAPQRQ